MKLTVNLKDVPSFVTVDASSVDVIHSTSDPKMIIITVGGVDSYWIDGNNFFYAVVS